MEIVVASDASEYGIVAVMLHKYKDGNMKAMIHASCLLLLARKKNYSQIEKEAWVIIFVVKKFHRFLHGRKFQLQTDHCPCLSVYGSKKGTPTHTASKLQCCGTTLLNYLSIIVFQAIIGIKD